jgi:hypothetical protein
MVGDGDAMRVARQVLQDVFGSTKRGLGVHHPILPEQAAHEGVERFLLSQRQTDSMEDQLVSLEGLP